MVPNVGVQLTSTSEFRGLSGGKRVRQLAGSTKLQGGKASLSSSFVMPSEKKLAIPSRSLLEDGLELDPSSDSSVV